MKNSIFTLVILIVATGVITAQNNEPRRSYTIHGQASFRNWLTTTETVRSTGVSPAVSTRPRAMFGVDYNIPLKWRRLQYYIGLQLGLFELHNRTEVRLPQTWTAISYTAHQTFNPLGFVLLGTGLKCELVTHKKSRLLLEAGGYGACLIGKKKTEGGYALHRTTSPILTSPVLVEEGEQPLELTRRLLPVGRLGLAAGIDLSRRVSISIGYAYILSGNFLKGMWTIDVPDTDNVLTSGRYRAGFRNMGINLGCTVKLGG
jgi:hypothetical protein